MKTTLRILMGLIIGTSTLVGQGTSRHFFGLVGSGTVGSGFQIYLDYAPAIAGTTPPVIADPGDLLVVVGPFAKAPTATALARAMIGAINDGFSRAAFPSGYVAILPTVSVPGELVHNATVQVNSPISLVQTFVSGGSGALPTTQVTSSVGNSINPTIIDLTPTVVMAHPGHPNAGLAVNGRDPRSDPFHVVEVSVPHASVEVLLSSGGNATQNILVVLGETYAPGRFQAAAGGANGPTPSIDVYSPSQAASGGLTVLLDGFSTGLFRTGPTGLFSFDFPAVANVASSRVALQAMIQDPTNTPFFISVSAAVDIQFAEGFEQELSLGSDSSECVSLQNSQFRFYGADYSSLHVHSNGFVTFQGPSTLSTGYAHQIDPLGALAAEPAIFANWSDWDPTSSVDGVTVRQFGGRFRVRWGSPENPIYHELTTTGDSPVGGHIPDGAGSFSLTLHTQVFSGMAHPPRQTLRTTPGAIFIDFGEFSPATTLAQGVFDNVFGIQPGAGLAGPGVESSNLGVPQTANGPLGALLSQDLVVGGPMPRLSVLPVGQTSQRYHNGFALGGCGFAFFPPQGASAAYTSMATCARRNDVTRAEMPQLAVSNLPPWINLVGQFRYLSSSSPGALPARVQLVGKDQSDQPIAVDLAILGVMTSGAGLPGIPAVPLAPGYREFEGLRVDTSSLGLLAP
ncbi:MAG: hypothetical protein KDB53_16430, partial [Planctomycetes bacterium]|nr:hypothetical protein [Planctomycetota bacterium]